MDAERRVLESAPPPADRRVSYGADPNQFIDVRFPVGSGPWPGMLAVHGGFWRAEYDLTYFGHFCTGLTDEGFVTFNVEYRRVGQPGGGWPGTFHDVSSAAEHVLAHADELRLEPEHLIAAGHSAGGHLALWLAGRHRVDPASEIAGARISVRAAVSLGGVADLQNADALRLGNDAVRELLGGSFSERQHRFAAASPAALVPMGIPQLIVHGEEDEHVPMNNAGRYVAAAQEAGDDVMTRFIAGIGHFEIVEPGSEIWSDVVSGIRAVSAAD